MEYLQSIGAQTAIFLRTVGFGFLLGLAYEALRLVRLLTGSRRIAVWDVSFGVFAGVVSFLFALTQNGGKVRVFFLAAIAVGFGICYRFAGVPIRAAADAFLGRMRHAAAVVRKPFDRMILQLQKIGDKLEQYVKKVVKSCKKNQKPS